MAIPLIQTVRISLYLLGKRLRGIKRYPLVLMLEPLFQCNLACAGCGKIDDIVELSPLSGFAFCATGVDIPSLSLDSVSCPNPFFSDPAEDDDNRGSLSTMPSDFVFFVFPRLLALELDLL